MFSLYFFIYILFFSFLFCCTGSLLLYVGFSLVVRSRDYPSLQCMGFSLWWLLLLWSTGSRRTGFSTCSARAQQLWRMALEHAGSVVVAHGLSCSGACGIFPDLGLNPCPLHWQVDSYLLYHQGSPTYCFQYSVPFSLSALSCISVTCVLNLLQLLHSSWIFCSVFFPVFFLFAFQSYCFLLRYPQAQIFLHQLYIQSANKSIILHFCFDVFDRWHFFSVFFLGFPSLFLLSVCS